MPSIIVVQCDDSWLIVAWNFYKLPVNVQHVNSKKKFVFLYYKSCKERNIRLPKRYESAPAHDIKGVTTEDTHNRRFPAMAVAQDVNGFPSKRKEKEHRISDSTACSPFVSIGMAKSIVLTNPRLPN